MIEPWHRRIRTWLKTTEEMPRERALTGLLRVALMPNKAALGEVLYDFSLQAANLGGQAAIDKIRRVLTQERAAEAVRVQEAPEQPTTLAERLARGEEWNAAAGEFTFNLRDPALLGELRKRGTEITGDVTDTMLQDLRDVLSKDFYEVGLGPREVAERIDGIFPPTYANRAENIARTETVIAQGTIGHETYERNGIEGKQWLALLDGKTRSAHAAAHGQVRKIGEPFIVGGEAMMHPGDAGASVGNLARCRCDELPVIDEDTDLPAQPWMGGAEPEAPPVAVEEPPAPKAKPKPRPKAERLESEEWADSLNDDEREALDGWFERDYGEIRQVSRTGTDGKDMVKAHSDMKGALDRAETYKGNTYRGISVDEDVKKSLMEGKELTLDSMQSATKSIDTAESFALEHAGERGQHAVVLAIEDSKTGVDVSHIARYAHEEEVLLRKGAHYRQISVSEKTWRDEVYTVIRLVEI